MNEHETLISTEINEMIKSIHNSDFSVFYTGYCKKVENENIIIERTNNNIELKKKIQIEYIITNSIDSIDNTFYNPANSYTPVRNWYEEQYVRSYPMYICIYITFAFNEHGKLIYFSVSRDDDEIVSVIVGDTKLLLNEKRWELIDGFHEQAFQKSLVENRTFLDDFQISDILKKFNIGQ